MAQTTLVLFMLIFITLNATAGVRTLQPTEMTTLIDPGDGDGDIVLVRFVLPDDLSSERITRAVLEFGVDCSDIVSVWAHPVLSEWGSETDRRWWLQERELSGEGDVSIWEKIDCRGDETGNLDVTRWVREWNSGHRVNLGIVLWPRVGSDRSHLHSTPEIPAPRLTVVSRPK